MADVVLVFPKIFLDQKFENPPNVPLSVLTLATYLIAKGGFDVKVIDQRIDSNWRQTLEEELTKDPILVGISSLSGSQIHFGLEVSKFVKERSKVLIVWGGLQATLEPMMTIQHPLVDMLVVGDGEIPLLELVRALKNKTSLDELPSLVLKENGKIKANPCGSPTEISEIPPIRFDLVDYKYYKHRVFVENAEVMFFVETSRGCANRCAYCTRSKNQAHWRALSPEQTVERFKYYRDKFRVRQFLLADENFFVDLKRVERIVDIMEKENLDIFFNGACRPEYVKRMDLNFLNRFEGIGFKNILFGAESGSDRMLKFINKGCTSQDIILANRKLVKTRLRVNFISIVGFPTETVDEIKQTVRLNQTLADENPNAATTIVKLIPIPGSVILDECVKAGYPMPKKLEDWIKIYDPLFLAKKGWINEDTLNYINKNEYYFQLLSKRKSNFFFRFLYLFFSGIHKIRDRHNFYGIFIEAYLYKAIKKIWLIKNRYLP